MYIQQIKDSHSLVLVIFHHLHREILGTIYIQLKNYPAIIYWVTKNMNSWDYHTALLLTIFFQFPNFFLAIFFCSVTSNYYLNNYTLPVLLLFSFYMAITQVLQLKNNLLKALHHQCKALNWTGGHRELNLNPWAELHLLSGESSPLFLLPRLCCPLFLCTVLKPVFAFSPCAQQCSMI